MRRKSDMYAPNGKKIRIADLYDAVPIVHEKWPGAYMEGSAGLQRVFMLDGRIVAHTWSSRNEFWWLRIFNDPVEY